MFQSITATIYTTYLNCNETKKYLYQDDAYSITWTPTRGQSTCNLPLDFLTYRNIEVSISFYGGTSSRCWASAYNWDCKSGISSTSCPALMYTTSSYSWSIGTSMSNSQTTSIYGNYLKLGYCDTAATYSIITIYVYSSYYYRWTTTWQFIYIGIPVIAVSIIAIIVIILIVQRNRRNRMLIGRQNQMSPTVAITTTSGGTNPGYQATVQVNQAYFYAAQPGPYNQPNLPPTYAPPQPGVYNQSNLPPTYAPPHYATTETKNIQEPMRQ